MLLAVLLLATLASFVSAQSCVWCNKPCFVDVPGAVTAPVAAAAAAGAPAAPESMTSTKSADAVVDAAARAQARLDSRQFIVRVSRQPFTIETSGQLIVTIVNATLDRATVTVSIATDGTRLLDQVSVVPGRNLFPFNVSLLAITTAAPTVLVAALQDAKGVLLAQTSLRAWRLPPKDNAVIVDFVSQGLFVETLQYSGDYALTAFMPFGYYYQWSQWLSVNLSNVDFVAAQGITNVHAVAGGLYWQPDLTTEFMDRVNQFGMKFQFDLKEKYTNLSLVADYVRQWKDHPAILGWYLADEPDGLSIDPTLLVAADDLIKSLDPYHPTALVLNCYYSAGTYENTADILLFDPYPIGINTTRCNLTFGDCGCDLCRGVVNDAPQRMDAARLQLGGEKPIWFVGQAFGPESYWNRAPTPVEERYMTYASIVHGARGVLYWTYPAEPGINSTLNAQIAQIAHEVRTLTPLIIGGTSLVALDDAGAGVVDVVAWAQPNGDVLVMLVNNLANAVSSFHVAVQPSRQQQLPMNGTLSALFSDSPDVPVQNGKFTDSLDSYAIHILYYNAS